MCGAEIAYTTKPPAKCQACREAEQAMKKKRKRKSDPRKSKSSNKEVQMFRELNNLLPGCYYIRNGYYSFLISPKDAPMQLDIFYPDLMMAFEYDGKQHTEYTKYFFRNKSKFNYLQECDALKDRLCKDLGITLIRINFNEKLTAENLKSRISKAGRDDVLKIMEGK
jgi:hypothetical protein